MSKVNPEVLAKSSQMDTLMTDVMNALRPSRNPQPAEGEVDELRYLLTLLAASEAVEKVRILHHMAHITDDELTKDVQEAGETITSALHNARFNMMMHMMTRAAGKTVDNMLNDILNRAKAAAQNGGGQDNNS